VCAEGDFSLTLSNDKGEELVIGLKDGEYYIDRTKAGECGAAPEIATDYGIAKRARYMDGKVEMDVTFDVSMLECFADEGTWAAAMAAFPTSPYTRVTCEGGEFEVAQLA
jgi:hypothetical protein